jgi:hypothetical protein
MGSCFRFYIPHTSSPIDGELTKSTTAAAAAASPALSRFDGQLVKSTITTLAFFLVALPLLAALPLLTALDGELGKSTMGI